MSYDNAGRRTDVEFDNGSSRGYVYGAAGQLTSTSGGPGGALTYTYDAFGRQTKVTDANGGECETFYDDLGIGLVRRDLGCLGLRANHFVLFPSPAKHSLADGLHTTQVSSGIQHRMRGVNRRT
jgi:YD repeat-containing protein